MIFSNSNNQLVSQAQTPAVSASAHFEFTPEQRVRLTMACVPLLHTLRKRIWAYSVLWCLAGLMIMSLAIPSMCGAGNLFLTLTSLIYGGSIFFFSVIRVIECRSLAALTEIGRSAFRRKAWMVFNGLVFLTAFVLFVIELCARPSWLPTGWVSVPVLLFVMIVSISPAWEWFFVFRVLANSKNLLEDFCRSLSLRYTRPEEMTILPLIIDSLYMLELLETKGVLKRESYAAIRNELIGLEANLSVMPSGSQGAGSNMIVSARPW